MAIQPWIKKAFIYFVIICLGILVGTQFGGTASATAPSISDVEPGSLSVDSVPMSPTQQWSLCFPDKVATYTTRLHIKCATDIDGIYFFAVPISDSKHAARMLATMLTAHATGQWTSVLFDPADTSNLPPGCLAVDCRLLHAIEIQ
jgi:hypothetical protein